jgi:hypothetical protein
MSNAYLGDNGQTPLVVYTTPAADDFSLDAITFVLHCNGTASEHHAQVRVEDNSGVITMVCKDWNVAPDGASIRYTFGIGLIPSACTVVDGEAVEHDLVNTVLSPKSVVIVSSVDESGAAIPFDEISACILYGDAFPVRATVPSNQPIYFMPGSQVA